jgi:transposase
MREEMMFKQLTTLPSIPKATECNARAIFGRKNFYILAGEHFESILEEVQPEALLETGIIFPQITFFQSLEGLTDDQANEAVRTRLDWKFAMHLPVYPPTLHKSALCQFRQQVFQNPQIQCEFQMLINRFVTFNSPLNHPFESPINLELVSHVCSINRLNWIKTTLSQMIEILAVRFPEWLRKITLPNWHEPYDHRMSGFETGYWSDQHKFSVEKITADIDHLLEEIHRASPLGISELQEVRALEHIWKKQIKKPLTDRHEILNARDCASCVYNPGWKEA